MTVPRLQALSKYWKNNPPLHILAAAYMGVGKQTKPKNDLGALFADVRSAGGQVVE